MCGGIAVQWKKIPEHLREQFHLGATRYGTQERIIQFKFRDPVPRLPAYRNAALGIYIWGNRDDKTSRLPHTGWCRVESLDEGKWNWLKPEPVEVPACLGYERGVWFPMDTGLRGVLVKGKDDIERVYMLTQAASPEYQALTKHERMPMFIGSWVNKAVDAPTAETAQTSIT